jgi:hypothetical protein
MKKPTIFISAFALAVLSMIGYSHNTGANQSADSSKPEQMTGMWLCSAPLTAYNFQQDLIEMGKKVTMTYAIIDQVATKDQCVRVNSDHLKPVAVSEPYPWASTVVIADGKKSGWATIEYYIKYMRTHKVDSQQ